MLGNNCIDGIREPKAGVQRAQPSAGAWGCPHFPPFFGWAGGEKELCNSPGGVPEPALHCQPSYHQLQYVRGQMRSIA